MSSGNPALNLVFEGFYSGQDQNNKMKAYIGEHDGDVDYTNLASIFRVWHKVSEAHDQVEEQEVCALVYSLLPKSCSRF